MPAGAGYRPRVASRTVVVAAAGLVAGALAVGVAWGWRGAVVFAFLAGLAVVLGTGLGVGGVWIQDWSRSRFEDDRRHGPRRRD
jgi:hypothetical protein